MNEREIFVVALQKNAGAERQAYLDEACGGDTGLRKRLDGLLEVLDHAGNFLESPPAQVAATIGHSEAERPGAVIGPYKLLQQIGEGGMGTVYMAEQTKPVQRKVALKIIKPGMDSRQVIARFEAERQALALMDHPNIAKVLDAGTIGLEASPISSEPRTLVSSGPGEPLTNVRGSERPYFVMELVKGVPITQYCDDHRLPLRQRLELVVPVCQAVQHAHQKGIIHRDLKPSNVLVALYDGRPVPKIIDFGVAKATGPRLTERTMFTEFGQVLGTLEYMSPEQAELNQLDIDTRSDIYALGVLIYELLTGTTPLERKRLKQGALLEMLRVIREEEPPRPSTRLTATDELPSIAASRGVEPKKLTGIVRGELDWIVMKCLEKDRARRYETANGLAVDLQRYLSDEPVQACPPSPGYRLRKFARRNKAACVAGLLVSAALLIAVVTLVISNIRIRQEKERAEEGFRQARQAVDDYFIRVSENKLLDVPGLQPLRKELLKTALDYYQKLAQRQGDDPQVQAELAKAQFRVGVITLATGSKVEALAALERARDHQEGLLQGRPGDTELQADLAATLQQIGITNRSLGRMDEAVRVHQGERTLWEELVRAYPKEARSLNHLAASYERIGETRTWTGQINEALPALQTSLQLRERLAKEYSAEPQFVNDLAGSYMELGVFRQNNIESALAIPAFEKACALREELVRAHPGILQFECDLAYSYRKLAEAHRQVRDRDKALPFYEKARPLLEKLARENPAMSDFQYRLAACYSGIAHVHWSKRERATAFEFFQRATSILRALLETDPDNATYQSDLALMHHKAGQIKFGGGELKEAEGLFMVAHDIWEKYVVDHPDLPEMLRCFAENCDSLGDLNDELNRALEARRYYRQALGAFERLVQNYPKGFYLECFADFLATCPDLAIRDAKRALSLATKAVELTPKRGPSWFSLGVAQYRTGNDREALSALEKSVALGPSNAMIVSLYLAMVHGRLGHTEEGHRRYQEADVLLRKLSWQSAGLRRLDREAQEMLRPNEPKKS